MKRWVLISGRFLYMIPTFVCLLQEAFEQCGHVLETWQSSVVCHTAYEEIYQSNASNVSTRNRQYVNNVHDVLHMKALVWGLVTLTMQDRRKFFLSSITDTLTGEASPWSDGSHQLLSWGEAPQSGHGLSSLQYTMLSGQSVHVRESKMDQRSWIPYHQPAYVVEPHTSMTMVKCSLVPSLPDFISQLWRKLRFSSTAPI